MNSKLIFATITAALGGILFGYETAVINGALPFLSEYFNFTNTLKGVTVSSALFGSIVGALITGRFSDLYGRRQTLKLMALLFLLSAIGTAVATNIYFFIPFRFIGGIAIGGASVISPLYISEIAPARFRGRMVISFQLAIVLGILLAFFIDFLLLDTGNNNWRYMLISMCLPAILFYVLLFFVGRSPRWLVMKGKELEAKNELQKLDPQKDSDITISEIRNSLAQSTGNQMSALFQVKNLKYILLAIAIGMFNQLTGINIIMYYTTDIFRSAGFSTSSALWQTVILGFVNLSFTMLAMLFIDKVGRKRLLLIGTIGMSVFLILFAYAYIAGSSHSNMLLFCMLGYIAFFASSQGAVIWVLLAEIFPNKIRATGASLGSFSHWFFNGLTTFLFPIVVGMLPQGYGIGYVFIFYGIMTLISFFVFKKYLVELKGKTLESIH